MYLFESDLHPTDTEIKNPTYENTSRDLNDVI